MLFIDKLKIFVEGGGGGDGCVSFRREKFIPRGGPNGGNGGNGGSVYLVGSNNVNTFHKLSFHPHWKADRGQHGKGSNQTGASGEDIFVPVPLGTIVYGMGEILAKDQTLLAAKGGKGGRGNTAFKSSTNRAPRQREFGSPGEKKSLELELKLLANVGLTGLPNAGKSTLLAALTRAKPKIASYPFTTTSPVLGVCYWKDLSFVIADIPGLIEGAHKGRGLGDDFLRHVERTKILIHLVDPQSFEGISPLKSIQVVERELKLWNKELFKKPRILVVTKSDLGPETAKVASQLRKRRKKIPILAISAHTGEGLSELKDIILKHL